MQKRRNLLLIIWLATDAFVYLKRTVALMFDPTEKKTWRALSGKQASRFPLELPATFLNKEIKTLKPRVVCNSPLSESSGS